MASFARTALAAGDHQEGLGNGTSERFSTCPSRKATLATRPPCRKCVVGWGLPARVGKGAAIPYDSCAVGGLVHVAIRAVSQKRKVVEVEGTSVKRLVTCSGAVHAGAFQYVVP